MSATFAWSFRMTEYLIDLRARHQEDFEYVANFEHENLEPNHFTNLIQLQYHCNWLTMPDKVECHEMRI